jgi:hypothetical protein
MATAKTRRNGGDPLDAEAPDEQQLRDAIIVHTQDGGRTFGYAIPPDSAVSPFAWPTVLRRIADRLEAQLTTGA